MKNYLDEMHNYFDNSFPQAMRDMRRAAKPTAHLIITGMTATPPDFDEPSPSLKAMTRCDRPTVIMYTKEEMAAFDTDLRPPAQCWQLRDD